MDTFHRTGMLIGEAGLACLAGAHVAVFGLGGVGGAAAEALARTGIGALTLVDGDVFTESNLNRQLGALHSTLGMEKAEVWWRRIADIAPGCRVAALAHYFSGENSAAIDFSGFDYVIDAIDQVSAKLLLVEACRAAGTPLISCMGTGNRMDPTKFLVGDISRTQDCGLARVMRRELRRRGIEGLRVVYSTEPPQKPVAGQEAKGEAGAGRAPGSVSFVPPVAGFILAGEAVRYLLAQ